MSRSIGRPAALGLLITAQFGLVAAVPVQRGTTDVELALGVDQHTWAGCAPYSYELTSGTASASVRHTTPRGYTVGGDVSLSRLANIETGSCVAETPADCTPVAEHVDRVDVESEYRATTKASVIMGYTHRYFGVSAGGMLFSLGSASTGWAAGEAWAGDPSKAYWWVTYLTSRSYGTVAPVVASGLGTEQPRWSLEAGVAGGGDADPGLGGVARASVQAVPGLHVGASAIVGSAGDLDRVVGSGTVFVSFRFDHGGSATRVEAQREARREAPRGGAPHEGTAAPASPADLHDGGGSGEGSIAPE